MNNFGKLAARISIVLALIGMVLSLFTKDQPMATVDMLIAIFSLIMLIGYYGDRA